MKCILGKKVGMTQIFLKSGEVVPVTRVVAGPCTVVAVHRDKKNPAVQLGFGEKKAWRVSKPVAGHLKDLPLALWLRDFTQEAVEGVERGDVVTVEAFAQGDKLTVVGTSKGKGFAGVVKRHHFRGGPASHGHKDNLRMPGSIGAGGVQRVFKGMRMAGRMGGDRVTVANLEVVEVHPETNELYIKGAIPGARNGLVLLSSPGEFKANKPRVAEALTETAAIAPLESVTDQAVVTA